MERKELSFYEFLKEQSAAYGGRPAAACGDTELSYGGLLTRVEGAAAELAARGLARGDRAVIWGFNSLEWLIAFYAVTAVGGVAVLMNYGISIADAGALAGNAGASMILYGGCRAGISQPDAPYNAADIAGIPRDRVIAISSLAQCRTEKSFSAAPVKARDTQVIIFTTGTTSKPKAVCLSSYSIINDAVGAYEILKSGLGNTVFIALPLFHSYGLLVCHVFLSCGKRVYLTPYLKPDTVARVIGSGEVDDMASVGAVYAMLTRLPQFEEKVKGRLNLCIVGGGFTTPAEMMRLEREFGGARILCGYGQTECSPVISVAAPDDTLETRAVSVGHILPGIEVRVWREDTGYAAHGEIGEIAVKGYCTMNGYFNAELTVSPFDDEGFLHTGDVGRLIDGDMLQLTGRLKDIIIRCGENISPAEIEQALTETDGVRSAKVMGFPHSIWGESVEACIVTEKPVPPDEHEKVAAFMISELKKKLSSYKIPSHIFIYDSFPLSDNGKLDVHALREDLAGRLPAVSAVSDGYDLGKTMLYSTEEIRRLIGSSEE